jgi:hypothetical protein
VSVKFVPRHHAIIQHAASGFAPRPPPFAVLIRTIPRGIFGRVGVRRCRLRPVCEEGVL